MGSHQSRKDRKKSIPYLEPQWQFSLHFLRILYIFMINGKWHESPLEWKFPFIFYPFYFNSFPVLRALVSVVGSEEADLQLSPRCVSGSQVQCEAATQALQERTAGLRGQVGDIQPQVFRWRSAHPRCGDLPQVRCWWAYLSGRSEPQVPRGRSAHRGNSKLCYVKWRFIVEVLQKMSSVPEFLLLVSAVWNK